MIRFATHIYIYMSPEVPVTFSFLDLNAKKPKISEYEVGAYPKCLNPCSCFVCQVEKETNFEFLLTFLSMFDAVPTGKECQASDSKAADRIALQRVGMTGGLDLHGPGVQTGGQGLLQTRDPGASVPSCLMECSWDFLSCRTGPCSKEISIERWRHTWYAARGATREAGLAMQASSCY